MINKIKHGKIDYLMAHVNILMIYLMEYAKNALIIELAIMISMKVLKLD